MRLSIKHIRQQLQTRVILITNVQSPTSLVSREQVHEMCKTRFGPATIYYCNNIWNNNIMQSTFICNGIRRGAEMHCDILLP